MVWTLKSDKTGREYDFDDDVAPEEALKYMDSALEPDQSWGDTVKSIPKALQTGLLKAQAGVATLGEDFIVKPMQRQIASLFDPVAAYRGDIGEPVGSAFAETQRAKAKSGEQQLQEQAPGVPSAMQQAVQSAGVSLGEALPDTLMAAGAARSLIRAGAPIVESITGPATKALASMSGREAAREYGEQREAGMGVGTSALAASIQGLAEYVPERFAWTPVLKLLGGSDASLKKAIGAFLFKDVVGEEITTMTEWLNKKLTRDPETTLADLAHEMQVTALSTGISGPVQGAVASAVYRRALREKVQKDLAEKHEPHIAGELGEIPGGALEPTIGIQPGEMPAVVRSNRAEPTIPILTDVVEGVERPKYAEPAEPSYVDRGRRQGTVVSDEELPLVGETPENGKSISRDLPIDLKLDLLRTSFAAYKNKSFTDTAEDRIAKRGEYLRMRADVERMLQFDPAGRTFLRDADLEMGFAKPDIAFVMEQEASQYLYLTPRQEEEMRMMRETTEGLEGATPGVPAETRTALGLPPSRPGDKIEDATSVSDYALAALQSTVQAELGGRTALFSNGKYDGLTYEQAAPLVKPGETVVFGRVGSMNQHAMSKLHSIISDLTKTYLPNYRVFISDYADDANALAHAYPSDKNTLVFTLPKINGLRNSGTLFDRVKNRFIMDANTIDVLETGLHEFTHLVHMGHWKSSPAYERVSVAREYHEDLAFARNASVFDAVSRLYMPSQAKSFVDQYEKAGGDAKKDPFLGPLSRATLPMFSQPTYWFNMNEWLANKGAKYFMTRLGVSSENRGFFQRLILKLQSIYRDIINAGFQPGVNFANWMNNIAARESGAQLAMKAEEMSEAKRQLIEKGLAPEIADMLATVNGSDRAKFQKMSREFTAAGIYPDNAQKELRGLREVQRALPKTTIADVLKELKSFRFASDLAAHPLFKDTDNPLHFLDSVLALVYKKNMAYVPADPGQDYDVFVFDAGGGIIELEYMKSLGLVTVLKDTVSPTGQAAAQLAVRNFLMRTLAEQGKTHVVINEDDAVWTAYGADGPRLEIPYYLHQPPLRPVEDGTITAPAELRIPARLNQMGNKLNIPFLRSTGNSLAWFNSMFQKTLGAYNLIKLNAHVPGMLEERQALRNRMAYRHKWLKRANATVEQWAYGIPKTESVKLARLLYDESESGTWLSTIQPDPSKPGERIFVLHPQEASRRGLDTKTQEVYSAIRNDFMLFADEWHKTALWEIARAEMTEVTHHTLAEMMRSGAVLSDFQTFFRRAIASVQNPQTQARLLKRLQETNDAFDAWKAKPYMPHTRFGRYAVLVKDVSTGKTKYFEGFETSGESHQAAVDIKQQFPADAVSTTYIEDVPYQFAGLPPVILDAMKTRLGLDQQQLEQYSEIMAKLSHANSFIHRASRKAGIEGYSVDALRAYSDYFRRGASFIARVKSQPELADAMALLSRYIQQETSRLDNVNDTTNLGRLKDWFTKLHGYLNDPGNEHGELKSMLALFHFGFNASSAAMNTLQVPFVTLPYLSERYGLTRSLNELKKAYADVVNMHTRKVHLAPDEEAMLDHALEAGFRDESQATVIAQLADGSALARATAHTAWGKRLNSVNHYAMWMFSKAELLNRDVTLLASYRLRRQAQFHGKFDRDAFDFARTTTEDTQNEYSQENRPEIMRGMGGVAFQFMHYAQNMIFMMFGGDASWWRLLAIQLATAGMLGLPFAADAMAAAKFIGRKAFGADWDIDRELRFYFKDLGLNPDYFMRGLSHNVFGFDLSKRLSLGDIIPGMQAIGSHQKFNDVLYSAVGDVGGPAVGLMMNVLKFMSENDKTSWDAIKHILPTAVKNFGNAEKALETGTVRDRSGAVLFEPEAWDLIGMAAGWQPRELSEKYEARTLEREHAAYWTTRRGALMEMFSHIMIERKGDREAVADFMTRLRKYNSEIPEPKLMLTGETLRNSVRERMKANVRKEAGLGSSPNTPQTSRKIHALTR